MGWRAQKCIPLVGAEAARTCTDHQTSAVHGGQYRAENGNLCKFESTYRHVTVFAPKQCLYQKEAIGMESLKMYSTHLVQNPHLLARTIKLPGSWRVI